MDIWDQRGEPDTGRVDIPLDGTASNGNTAFETVHRFAVDTILVSNLVDG